MDKRKAATTPATKHARGNQDQTKLSHLPSDILFNIFSRLPVTTLVRAAYTCKLFYSILTNPIFQDSHFTRALQTPPGHLYKIDSTLHFSDTPTHAITIPGDLAHCICFSSCRGLLGYRSIRDSAFYICNPITNDRIQVPYPLNCVVPYMFSLGYAPVANRYKYVQFTYGIYPDREILECNIFTLGETYWRHLDVPTDIGLWREAVYKNGCFYMMVLRVQGENDSYAMSLDLDTEKFRRRRTLHPGHLTLIGETITLMVLNRDLTQDVWMLIDEVEDVWVKSYCFRVEIPLLDNNIMDFIFSELWMKRRENDLGPDSICNELAKKGMNVLVGFQRKSAVATIFKLPITSFEDVISLQWAIAHVGSLVSPSKIVEAAMKQPSSISR